MRSHQRFWSLRNRRFPLLPRPRSADKSRFGHVLVMAGSKSMPGAAVLTATAALKAGSGLVTLAASNAALARMPKLAPEIMRVEPGRIAALIKARRIRTLAVGPGLGTAPALCRSVRRLVARFEGMCVLDADGLNAFRGHATALNRTKGRLILTPHRREFERLFGLRWPEGEAPRAALAKKLNALYDVVLVLKGANTLVAEGGRVYRNATGNPGMAKGGSGDVLTGMIAAFCAQGLKPFEAACWGVYLHGKAGDRAVRRTGQLGLTASDIIAAFPAVLK